MKRVWFEIADRVNPRVALFIAAVLLGLTVAGAVSWNTAQQPEGEPEAAPSEMTAPVEQTQVRFVLDPGFTALATSEGLQAVTPDLAAVARTLGAESIGEVQGADDPSANWWRLPADGGDLVVEASFFEDAPPEMRVSVTADDPDGTTAEPVEVEDARATARMLFDAAGVQVDELTVEQPAVMEDGQLRFGQTLVSGANDGVTLGEVSLTATGELFAARVVLAEVVDNRVEGAPEVFRDLYDTQLAEATTVEEAGIRLYDLPELLDAVESDDRDEPVTVVLVSARPATEVYGAGESDPVWVVTTSAGGTLYLDRAAG